jgi:hypothetical protein
LFLEDLGDAEVGGGPGGWRRGGVDEFGEDFAGLRGFLLVEVEAGEGEAGVFGAGEGVLLELCFEEVVEVVEFEEVRGAVAQGFV